MFAIYMKLQINIHRVLKFKRAKVFKASKVAKIIFFTAKCFTVSCKMLKLLKLNLNSRKFVKNLTRFEQRF